MMLQFPLVAHKIIPRLIFTLKLFATEPEEKL
jgi:hypothetical protein